MTPEQLEMLLKAQTDFQKSVTEYIQQSTKHISAIDEKNKSLQAQINSITEELESLKRDRE